MDWLIILLTIVLVAAIIVGTVFLVLGVNSTDKNLITISPGAGWHTIQNTFNHSSRTINKGPITKPGIAWSNSNYKFNSRSVAVADDGTIYIGTIQNNTLIAFNPNGSIKWQVTLYNNVLGTPSIGRYGIIYVVDIAGNVTSITPQGVINWVQSPAGSSYMPPTGFEGFSASPVIHYSSSGDDDILYIATNKIYILDSKTGETLNTFTPDAPNVTPDTVISSTPTIDSRGNLYFVTSQGFTYPNDGQGGGYLYKIDAQTKTLTNFRFDSGEFDNNANLTYSPEHDLVFISAVTGYIFAVKADLSLVYWQLDLQTNDGNPEAKFGVIRGFALSQDGDTLYAGTSNDNPGGNLFAINIDQSSTRQKWNIETNVITGAPVVDADDNIYFSDNLDIYCLDKNGNILWTKMIAFGNALINSVVLGNKSIYIQDSPNTLYALA